MYLITTRPRIELKTDLPAECLLGPSELPVQAHWLPAFDLSIAAGAQDSIRNWLNSCKQTIDSIAVFVSPGALMVCRSAFPDPWPAGLLCGVMGEGSAAVAQNLGIPLEQLVYPDPSAGFTQDSAGFIEEFTVKVNSLKDPVSICNALIIKGPRGRNVLAKGLSCLGVRVQELQAYQRDEAVWSDLNYDLLNTALQEPCIWYFTSSEAVTSIAQRARDWYALEAIEGFAGDLACMLGSPVVTTHHAITQAAVEAGFTDVHTIAPGMEALKAFVTRIVLDSSQSGSGIRKG